MFDFESWIPELDGRWIWISKVFIVVLLTAIANFLVKRVLARILVKFSQTDTNWDDVVLKALTRPLTWMVWLVGLDVAVDIVFNETQNRLFDLSNLLRDVGVLVCLAWFLLGFIRGAEREFSENSDAVDRTTAEAISKLLRLAVMITAGLVIMQTLGFSVSGVMAMGGVGGIALGFAAKDLLANFFGGLMIYMDRPFAIGDWIRSPDRDIEGTVESIGWRVSVIRNFESRPMYVPNSVFSNIIVENPSRMANRRIYETIGLRYSDLTSMATVVEEVETMLRAHHEIESSQTMMVNFTEFSDSSVDFFIYCFTKTKQWAKYHQVKQDVMLQIAKIIAANQAEIAFPTSTLHFADALTVEND